MIPGATWSVDLILPQPPTSVLGRLLMIALLVSCTNSYAENIKAERRRTEQVLNLVSKDVQDNYYDYTLKGLDWPGAPR